MILGNIFFEKYQWNSPRKILEEFYSHLANFSYKFSKVYVSPVIRLLTSPCRAKNLAESVNFGLYALKNFLERPERPNP